uniref:NR LBD domain-containing protein n=1 Tax=Parastrongyloides trichosuri TaxID=131310 RepID=A0A0N4Z249_PARTI
MQQLQKLTLDINLSDTLIGCCKDSSNMIHYINIQNPYTPAITQEVNISDLKNILCNITKLVLSNCSKNIDNKRWDILFTFIKVHLPLLKIIEHEKNEISSLIIEKFNYKINDNIFFKIIDRDDEEPENYQSVLNISSQHDVTRRMNLIYELSISYLYNNIEHLTWKFQDSLMIMANHLILDVGFWTFKNIKMETFIAVTNCLSKYHSNKESLIITNDTGMKEPEDTFSEPNETLMRSILSSWKKLSFLLIDNGFLCPTKACLDNLLSGCNKSLKYMSLNYKFIDVETINYITKVT